jgi:hypothetical protein
MNDEVNKEWVDDFFNDDESEGEEEEQGDKHGT